MESINVNKFEKIDSSKIYGGKPGKGRVASVSSDCCTKCVQRDCSTFKGFMKWLDDKVDGNCR